MNVEFKNLSKAITKRLSEEKFASIIALTRTASQARVEVQKEIGKQFTIRNKFTQRGVIFKPATKQNIESRVELVNRAYLAQYEAGNPSETKRNGSFAIPVNLGKVSSFNNKKLIPRRLRPRQALEKLRIKGNRPFIATVKNTTGIFVRLSKASNPITLLYNFTKSRKVKRTEFFSKTVRGFYDKNFLSIFAKTLAERLKRIK